MERSTGGRFGRRMNHVDDGRRARWKLGWDLVSEFFVSPLCPIVDW